MSMRKWSDEELASTQEKLEAWRIQYRGKGWGPRLWLLTALLGAFAISTGVAFMFLDGVTALSIILILMGFITCFSWYQSERRKKVNITYLEDINKELHRRKRRKEKAEKAINKKVPRKQGAAKNPADKKTADNKVEKAVESNKGDADKDAA